MINLYTNTSSTSSTSRNGVSGLMSGMDTEGLVKSMTSSVQSRITKQIQNKQLLSWKSDAYQSVSQKLIDFSNKYLSYASTSNMLTKNFYKSTVTNAVGKNAGAVTVSGTSASAKNLSIQDISSYATYANFITDNSAVSNTIKTGTIDFSTEGKTFNSLAGETINISYNGNYYNVKFDKDFTGTTAEDVAEAFNTALTEIKIDDDTKLSDKIVMNWSEDGSISISAADSDDTNKIYIAGGSGTSLSVLGIRAGASSEAQDQPITGSIDDENITYLRTVNDMAGKSITFDLNGIQRSITIPSVDLSESKSENSAAFISALQSEIDKAFGSNKIKVGFIENSDFTGELTFETVKKVGNEIVSDSTSVLTLTSADSSLTGEKSVFNFTVGSSNRLKSGTALSDINFNTELSLRPGETYKINVNGHIIDFTSDMTLTQILDKINKSDAGVNIQYLSTTNKFSVTATNSGTAGGVSIEDVTGNFAEALFGVGYEVNEGTDAQIEISYDGGMTKSTVIRTTNNFNIDGLEIKLNPNVEFVDGEAITFESKSNTDSLVNNIKQMIDEYNSIVEYINKEVSTSYNSKYPPLTSDQKAEMTESQIKEWEDIAKTGMLYGDSTLRSLATELRFVFSNSIPGVGNAFDIGLKPASSYSDNGKILIDEDKLRKAIEERPDDVIKMFTMEKSTASGATSNDAGLMQRIKTITDKYASTVGANKGILVQKAGVKDSNYTIINSSLYKQMSGIDKMIEKLQRTLKSQEDRYYKQFASLETYMSKISSQSSLFSSNS